MCDGKSSISAVKVAATEETFRRYMLTVSWQQLAAESSGDLLCVIYIVHVLELVRAQCMIQIKSY